MSKPLFSVHEIKGRERDVIRVFFQEAAEFETALAVLGGAEDRRALDSLELAKRLLKNGLAFNRAHCNSCTCSPSRVTLFTSTFPAHHRVTQVLGFDDPTSTLQMMQQTLASNLPNMGKMMEAAGYQVAYKGKWHLTKPTVYLNNTGRQPDGDAQIDQLYWTPADPPHIAAHYRFKEWNWPDAGDDMAMFNFGGGDVTNG